MYVDVFSQDEETMGVLRQAIPELTGLLQDSSAKTRRLALQTLGAFGDPATVKDIAYLLSDEKQSVRLAAVRVLAGIGGDEVTSVLRAQLEGAEDEELRDEIEEAEIEGIKFHFLSSPCKILCDRNACTGVECFEMELGQPDEGGRRAPLYVAGSEFNIEADMVISAVGQTPDITFLPEGAALQVWQGERLVVDKYMATNTPGIFAGGDVVTGPSSVIKAIAAGKKAAVAIDCYLRGKPYPQMEPDGPIANMEDPVMQWHLREIEKDVRAVMPVLDVNERKSCFKEVHEGLGKDEAIGEARRCLTCRISSMGY